MKELMPIGTVVTLKNGTKKLMIVGRLQAQKDSSKVYDYAACLGRREPWIHNTSICLIRRISIFYIISDSKMLKSFSFAVFLMKK